VHLASRVAGAKVENGELAIPLPAVEAGIDHSLPQAGSATSQMKVLDQQASARSLLLRLAAPANTVQTVFVRVNNPKAHFEADGAETIDKGSQISVRFPGGSGYVEKDVRISW
jgi:hypothetical protein